jgi:GT2 family glycosyltransferase
MIPILICTYNRPDHLRSCLESIILQEGLSNFQIIIFRDGSRDMRKENLANYSKSSKVIEDYKEHIYLIIESLERVGAISGYRHLIYNYGISEPNFVILEDDIILKNDWSKYILSSLKRIEANNHEYLSISSMNFYPRGLNSDNRDIGLMNFNAWGSLIFTKTYLNLHEFDSVFWRNNGRNYLIRFCTLSRIYFSYPHLFSQIMYNFSNGIFCGDSLYSFFCFLTDKKNFWDGNNYVTNIGFDGSGLNCPNVTSNDISINDIVLKVGLFTKTIAILRYFFVLLFWNYIKVKDINEVNNSSLNLFRGHEYTSL